MCLFLAVLGEAKAPRDVPSLFFLILIFLSSKFVFLLCFCSFTADNSYSHFHSKRESRKMDSPIQAISISKQANLHRFQGLGIILCGLKLIPLIPWLYPWPQLRALGPKLCLRKHLACILNGAHVCHWVLLSACFLLVKFWESHSLLSVHLLSLLSVRDGIFNADLTCSKSCSLPYVSWGVMPLDKSLIQRFPPGKSHLYSLLLLRWLGSSMIHSPFCFKEPSVWIPWYFDPMEVLAKECLATSLILSLQDTFLTVNPFILMYFCKLDRLRISHIYKSSFFFA